MKNPSNIDQPRLNSPISRKQKRGNKNGNQPYLNFRRKMRKGIFGKR